MTIHIEDGMMDITAPDTLQVQIRSDDKVIWINMDGKCVFRACRINKFELIDDNLKRNNIPII